MLVYQPKAPEPEHIHDLPNPSDPGRGRLASDRSNGYPLGTIGICECGTPIGLVRTGLAMNDWRPLRRRDRRARKVVERWVLQQVVKGASSGTVG